MPTTLKRSKKASFKLDGEQKVAAAPPLPVLEEIMHRVPPSMKGGLLPQLPFNGVWRRKTLTDVAEKEGLPQAVRLYRAAMKHVGSFGNDLPLAERLKGFKQFKATGGELPRANPKIKRILSGGSGARAQLGDDLVTLHSYGTEAGLHSALKQPASVLDNPLYVPGRTRAQTHGMFFWEGDVPPIFTQSPRSLGDPGVPAKLTMKVPRSRILETGKHREVHPLGERVVTADDLLRYGQDAKIEKISSFKLDGEQKFRGLDIAIENAKGSVRKWKDSFGKETGSTLMKADYGYIRGTQGADKDHVDVYVGPDEQAAAVYIVNQMRKPDFKVFDEHKCLIGFSSLAEARKLYLSQYNDPRFLGSIRSMPFNEFKVWVFTKTKTKKEASQQTLPQQSLPNGKHPIIDKLGYYEEPEHRDAAQKGMIATLEHFQGKGLLSGEGQTALKMHQAGEHDRLHDDHFAPAAQEEARHFYMQSMGYSKPAQKIAFAVTPGMLSGLRHVGISPAKTAAISPAALSMLQHGGAGAGIGAIAGGIGGALHGGPEHRGQGALRGAFAGGALGAAGGAGIAAIKGHGAQQLASLQSAAHSAEQEAVTAHSALRGMPTVADVGHAPTLRPAPVEAGTLAGKAGRGRPMAAAPSGAPQGIPLNTQQRAVMDPAAWGGAAPASTPASRGVAESIASARGGSAEALRQAANTLEGQQAVMNRGINRAGLVGAAAGTGLMGYTAVPKEYGGVGQKAAADVDALAAEIQRMKAEKALDDRVGKYDAALDSFGIGALAAPYVAESLGHGLTWAGDKIMPRSTRLGAGLATAGNFLERGAKSMHHSNLRELGGLALVTPMVTHPIAHALAKRSPQPAAPLAAPPMPAMQTAEKIGRLLAQPREKVAISVMGAVRGAANFAWQNKKPLAGIAAVGAVGAGLYGAKKGIDTAANLAQPHHAARFVGAPPGQQVMGNSAYQPLG